MSRRPDVPLLDMEREPVPDQYELERYLNVLHETDRHLGRLFETVRRLRLEQDTLIVVIGDHGQAFGYPHDTYIQGRTVYEEDVHVPLMFWFPRLYHSATRRRPSAATSIWRRPSPTSPGCPPAPDWQGRSLFDTTRSRARVFLRGRGSLHARGARGRTGSTSSRCGKASRSCTTSITIRTSSTISRPHSRSAARGCASGWPRGRTPTGGSTDRPGGGGQT